MSANAVVRARIDETTKKEAEQVLADMGLTISDLVRMTLKRVARDKALPFELTPNALTVETLRKSERGENLHHAKDVAELFKKLGI
jgi:DNA-damage-inducible protein J